jgi:hypothetical protein
LLGCDILNEGMPPKVASTPYTVLGAGSDCACISSCTTYVAEENEAGIDTLNVYRMHTSAVHKCFVCSVVLLLQ